MLKAIHAQEDREAARVKVRMVTEKLKQLKLEKAAALVEESRKGVMAVQARRPFRGFFISWEEEKSKEFFGRSAARGLKGKVLGSMALEILTRQ